MKSFKLLTLLLLINHLAISQIKTTFKEGVYTKIENLKSNSPDYQYNFIVTKKDSTKIKSNGGNLYELTTDSDTIKKKFIRKELFSYVKNDSVFINGLPLGISTDYCLALTTGTFIVFEGSMTNELQNQKVMPAAIMFGAIGAAVATTKVNKESYNYILSLNTGNVRYLSSEYVEAVLAKHVFLLNDYLTEPHKDATHIMIKYIQLLNEELSN